MSISAPVWLNSAKTLCRLVALIILLSLHQAIALAGQVTLSWDSNTEPDLGGYRLYYGQSSRNYTANVDVGNQTTHTQSDLEDGVTYYFAVTAYDTNRTTESDFSNEVSQTITPPPPALDADFSANPTNGTAPLEITFTDTSTGDISTWSWDFGDGNTSTAQHPNHNYTAAGTYTVALTVTGPGGSDSITKTNLISVATPPPPPPVADFSASPTSGTSPLAVTFTDASTGDITNWSWDFGDGGTSTAQHPNHNYTEAGLYTVTLTTTGPGGSNSTTQTGYISVFSATGNRVTDGQLALYGFEEGTGDTVRDISGTGTPLNLTVSDLTAVSWLPDGGIAIDAATTIQSAGPATKVHTALQASQALTIEAWVVPNSTIQGGPARIAALSLDPSASGANFMMGQHQALYETRLRTTTTDLLGRPALSTPTGTATTGLTHVVYTRDAAGTTRFYVNGVEQASSVVNGDFSNWGNYALTLVNEPTGDRPWLGVLHLVALYDRALDATEVNLNFVAGPGPGPDTVSPVVTAPDDLTMTAVDGNGAPATNPTIATWLSSATAVDNRDGALLPSHDAPAVFPLGATLVTFTATDAAGNITTAASTVTVEAQVVAPVADFSANPTNGTAPLQVTFTDTSTGDISTWSWDFGDGNTSTTQHPSHNYIAAGTYTITLTATGPGGSNTATKTNLISVATPPPPPPVANFSATPTSGTAPLAATFTDTSTGDITSWSWDFGDGGTSTTQHPNHNYTAAGTYTVSLTVTGPGGSDSITKTNLISVTTPEPVADFNASPTSGTSPLAVTFTDTSTGDITSWSWNFGDGNTGSGSTALKSYTDPGQYTVSLTVTGPGGSDSITKTNLISVTTPAPVADFSASPTSGTSPLAVAFTDTSTGDITSWSWDFGDGGTSTAQHPSHNYAETGTYTVTLTVTGPGGSNSKTQTDYITASSPGPDPRAGLVAAYGFEEPSGTQVLDASAEANHGVISGASRIDQGHFGHALSFDGINDWVTIEDAASLDLSEGMTLEAWVYPTNQSGWRTVFMKERPGWFVYMLNSNISSGQPYTTISTGSGSQYAYLYGNSQLPANTWSHLATTYDRNRLRLYVNGIEVGSTWQTASIWQSDGPLRIGGTSIWTAFFQGYIDEVRVYNRALAASEIQADMTTPVSDSNTAEPPALMEVGEVDIDEQWRRVPFSEPFVDPVVLAKPLSLNDTEPALVRIRNVDATGFDIRLQEWDYLDGFHALESVGYLVMERGRHTLEDGTQVEAGRFDANDTDSFKTVTFNQAFQTTPVVLTAVSSFNENDAVATRIHSISNTDFQFQMQEQEANAQTHTTETASYIAWEVSSGTVNNIAFEVNRTADVVRHTPYNISFQELFVDIPVFLADMQTTDGSDSANLRWDNKSLFSVDVKVAEEQSEGSEMNHTSEVVGYMLFSTLD